MHALVHGARVSLPAPRSQILSGSSPGAWDLRGVEHIPWLYDASQWVFERTGLASWRRWLAQGAGGHTLDLGTGTGRNLPWFGHRARVVALDPDRRSLRRARRRASTVPLVVGRAEALPFRDRAFDTVVSGLVFCSVEQPDTGLAEVRRVLRADGELRMLEHVRSRSPLLAWWQDAIQPAWTWFAGGCRPNRDTERVVEDAGFTIDPADRRAEGTMRRFLARPTPTHD